MKKHFVTFFSPGTFVSESTKLEIPEWDTQMAVAMSSDIEERHGAVPYGFRFSTQSRGPEDLDSEQSATSNMYYLGGDVLTLAQVKERNDPADSTLIWNMETNGYDRVVVNTNSWKATMPCMKRMWYYDHQSGNNKYNKEWRV